MSTPNTTVRDGIARIAAPGTRWLSTGWNGGYTHAPAAYNITVPDDWAHTDLHAYGTTRVTTAGFPDPGPMLFTSAPITVARGAHTPPVTAYATVGLSNPTALPVPPPDPTPTESQPAEGTVNVILWTDHALTPGAHANLLAQTVEARTTTLLTQTGFPGTTTDATIVGCPAHGDPVLFTGSATPIGAATHATVRDAIDASLAAAYPDSAYPRSVQAADHGTTIDQRTDIFTL